MKYVLVPPLEIIKVCNKKVSSESETGTTGNPMKSATKCSRKTSFPDSWDRETLLSGWGKREMP